MLDCLESGWLTMGPRTKAFEQALAGYVGTPHAVTVSSGTAALHLACLAAGDRPRRRGDRAGVHVRRERRRRRATWAPSRCCATCAARTTSTSTPRTSRARITPRTRAIVAVHFCGYPADVAGAADAVRRARADPDRGLRAGDRRALDACGRQVGTVGELGAFSFFSKKQLCVGEGGMVTSADEQLAERVRLLRSHAMTSSTWDRHRGHDPAYDVVDIGFNYRLDEPRAALGLSRLGRLAESIEHRRASVRAYRERLAGVAGIELPFDRRRRRALLAFRLSGAARRPRDARPLPRRAQSRRHPDDLVPGAAHVHRVPALRARGRPAACQRGR